MSSLVLVAAFRFITPDDEGAYRVWKGMEENEKKRRDEIRAGKSG